MFGTWFLPYPNGGGIFTEMYSDSYFGTVDAPDGTTSDSGSRLSTLVRCTEIRLSSVVVVQLRSTPDVQTGGPYTYSYTWWVQGDYPDNGFGLFCPRTVFDSSSTPDLYLTGSRYTDCL